MGAVRSVNFLVTYQIVIFLRCIDNNGHPVGQTDYCFHLILDIAHGFTYLVRTVHINDPYCSVMEFRLARESIGPVSYTHLMISGETIAASSCYKTTNAGKAGAIYEIDPENLERQSPDLLDTLWTMGKLLYPESFVHNEPGQPWESSPASMGYIPDEEDTAEPETAEPENPDEAESQTSSEEESSSAA